MIDVNIIDGGGNGVKVRVTSIGQLVTAPASYDETAFRELAVDDTAYNFYGARAGQQFVVTGVLFRADKQVSSTVDAIVVIYEATTDSTITVSKVLIQFAVVQGDIISATPLNILVTEGRYVNAKTTDDDIHMTIMGYYVDKIS
jgi:hypothetical protein